MLIINIIYYELMLQNAKKLFYFMIFILPTNTTANFTGNKMIPHVIKFYTVIGLWEYMSKTPF